MPPDMPPAANFGPNLSHYFNAAGARSKPRPNPVHPKHHAREYPFALFIDPNEASIVAIKGPVPHTLGPINPFFVTFAAAQFALEPLQAGERRIMPRVPLRGIGQPPSLARSEAVPIRWQEQLCAARAAVRADHPPPLTAIVRLGPDQPDFLPHTFLVGPGAARVGQDQSLAVGFRHIGIAIYAARRFAAPRPVQV